MTFEKRFRSLQQRFSGAALQPPGEHFAVEITLTDPPGGKLYVANTVHGFEIAPYDYHDHTAALQISGSNLVKLLNGTLSAERAAADGRITVLGNLEHIKLLRRIADAPPKRARRTA